MTSALTRMRKRGAAMWTKHGWYGIYFSIIALIVIYPIGAQVYQSEIGMPLFFMVLFIVSISGLFTWWDEKQSARIKRQIVGKWSNVSTNEAIEFNEDGALALYGSETATGRWSIHSYGRVKIELAGVPVIMSENVEICGNRMEFMDETDQGNRFIRVEEEVEVEERLATSRGELHKAFSTVYEKVRSALSPWWLHLMLLMYYLSGRGMQEGSELLCMVSGIMFMCLAMFGYTEMKRNSWILQKSRSRCEARFHFYLLF